MPLYKNSVIYKLVHKNDQDNENIYIGSTTNFRSRKLQHKKSIQNENDKKYNQNKYQYIRENGGWEEWEMIAIENYSCESKRELEIRERYHIETLKAKLNKNIPNRTKKEYREDNKEIISKKKHEDYINNVEYKLLKQKIYYENNKEEKKNYDKIYREKNKEKIRERRREYEKEYRKNPKRIEWERTKIKCEICGCEITRAYKSVHQKTKKCCLIIDGVRST